LIDHDGIALTNVTQNQEGDYVLTSKVTGNEHIIPTAMSAIIEHPQAACAMNENHLRTNGGLECYACHTSWVPNCFGCHFERDETKFGLNYVTGELERGKVTTNNKIFEALRHFAFGPNSEGRIAPYIVACHPIADVTGKDGEKILDFVMPVTSNGLSGLGHNPVQPHTVRGHGDVRSCAECHRSPATLGLGSGLFQIARDTIFTAGGSGLREFSRYQNPDMPVPMGTLNTPAEPLALVSKPHVVEGTAEFLYAALGTEGVVVYDRTGIEPNEPVVLVSNVNAIEVNRDDRYLFVVEEAVGVHIYDNQNPLEAIYVSSIDLPNATKVIPWGIYAFVPSMEEGLFIINIADYASPYVAAHLDGITCSNVQPFSHYQIGSGFAVRAYVADPTEGVHIIDLLPDIETPTLVETITGFGANDVDVYTRWVIATETEPSREHDYLYVAAAEQGLIVYDITNPDDVYEVSSVVLGGNAVDIEIVSQLAPPGVDDYAVIANEQVGLQMVDVTDPLQPISIGTVPDKKGISRVFVEFQQMDRFLSEQGNTLKENSHPFTGTLSREDIVRILSASIDCDETPTDPSDVNGDGVVNVNDLLAVIGSWGVCPSCPEDVNGDGVVGVADLLQIIADWGS
jgi:hypothetical protein